MCRIYVTIVVVVHWTRVVRIKLSSIDKFEERNHCIQISFSFTLNGPEQLTGSGRYGLYELQGFRFVCTIGSKYKVLTWTVTPRLNVTRKNTIRS